MTLSYATTDFIEGSVISAVILLNVVVGFIQDYRAEKTMQSLHSLSAPLANVLRDGQMAREKAENLVVGDIVKVSVGDIVPADLRLFDGMNLEIDEALLTGESMPALKAPSVTLTYGVAVGVGDQTNMAFSSSTVTKGRGLGVVVNTGMKTEVGLIAALLRNQGPMAKVSRFRKWYQKFKKTGKSILGLIGTPLQVKLSKFALVLFGLAILLAIIVFSANKWQINNEVLIYGICVAVAVIPESLIAVLTITMAVGTKTMARGNVIVRKLQALEAVGGVTNICSDKTGTLTQGKMIAKKAFVPGLGLITIHNATHPFDPTSGSVRHKKFAVGGTISDDLGALVDGDLVGKSAPLENFLNAIALCNLATVSKSDRSSHSSEESIDSRTWTATGEPTEISLQVLAMRFCHGKQALQSSGNWNLVAEHSFDSSIKKMSVVYEQVGYMRHHVFTKGAGEVLVPTLNLSEEQRDGIMNLIERMAGEGLRVLCVAHKILGNPALAKNRSAVENSLDFVGLVGLYDPPRVETRDAVRKCQVAGVKVHMLTGDHIRTATAIAHEVGILTPAIPSALASTIVMTAGQFDALTDVDIDALPQLPLVIARCSPTTKVRMVEALHRRGAFCVMTGDGVNDSPALKRADVGIAMGMNGSDVAKDASDLVLTDDNFASIIRAVEEGRRLFDNIQKFLMHLLISNISQVVLLLIGLAFRDERGLSVFPLSPLEILWVNMITSSFLALGLGLEEAQSDIMLRPPHDLRAGVFTWEVIIDKMVYGVTMGALCLAAFLIVVYGVGNGALGSQCNERFWEPCYTVYRARATVFAVLSFLLLLTAWEVKHFSRSLFNLDPTKHKGPFAVFHAVWYNRFLFWAVIAGFVITFPVIYIPVFNTTVFHHTSITWEWSIVGGCCLVYLAVVESWKAIKRRMEWGSGKNWALTDGEDVESRIWDSFMADSTREGTLIGTSAVTTRTNTLVEEEGGIMEKE
ncbi:potassium/sodium eff [Terfezia boudieri ATCC MYA-4762]|uniref:P-type Na(+) transporter n=1 Tax=Terfezia boudieri ATCC MYA-4762 TaxID=1051890 RepID=A0A3N4LE48_9PEZI|nr:potassium/sodium eff [Terfezia boudieri ATCC MYA-4762]